MDFDTLLHANFGKLDAAVSDWNTLVGNLEKLDTDAKDGLKKTAFGGDWRGVNSDVTRKFISKTVGEFADAHTQADSIRNILRDTASELRTFKGDLTEAISNAQNRNISVRPNGTGFIVRAVDGDAGKDVKQGDVDSVRDQIKGILDKASESDSTAARVLRSLVDQADKGFGDASYKDRDQAADAVKTAEDLAELAKKDPSKLTVEEFDRLNAGLAKYNKDDLFAEAFAQKLGAQGTLDFWAKLNDANARDFPMDGKRLDQYSELQKNLSLTLANATQSASPEMSSWKTDMLIAVEKPVNGVSGYVVMSNLMRWGDYDDDFLTSYGSGMMAKEQEGVRNGRSPDQIWGYNGGGLWPHLNSTGTDHGFDPMTGYMKALSNSPDAATQFFNSEFIDKDADGNPYKRDTDGNGKKGHVDLTNFQYLFEERDWMREQDSKGDESISGKNYLAAALEAATTGHPAGELPTSETVAHSKEQADLYKSVVESVSKKPDLLTGNGYMSDSFGQMTAEYMPDINRALAPEQESKADLFIAPGAASELKESDVTRFLYTLGRNPEGYAAVTLGQHNYSSNLFEYHAANPNTFIPDEKALSAFERVGEVSGEVQGILGSGRAYESELQGGEQDAKYNDALDKASEWGGALAGTGIGLLVAPTAGPGAVIAGDLAGTFAGEAISAITGGMKKDSTDDVIFRNGKEWDDTSTETYRLLERQATAAGEAAGSGDIARERKVAAAAEDGFNNAGTNVGRYLNGEGVPQALETKK
ncbi:DUF6571 family protein [Streptomyces sp. NPDC017979]|uniref:DUF6571 family protein n=1 Tax=Streptomyces sp. NPDC017979 TaxID=3365024 RepID=UPI0037AED66C